MFDQPFDPRSNEDYEGTENISNSLENPEDQFLVKHLAPTPLSLYDMGLYTTMRDITRDANGHILDIITRSTSTISRCL
ncbi:MAG: hypothetical protein WA364_25835 [Candidatus Nitrosopolaris sp.]